MKKPRRSKNLKTETVSTITRVAKKSAPIFVQRPDGKKGEKEVKKFEPPSPPRTNHRRPHKKEKTRRGLKRFARAGFRKNYKKPSKKSLEKVQQERQESVPDGTKKRGHQGDHKKNPCLKKRRLCTTKRRLAGPKARVKLPEQVALGGSERKRKNRVTEQLNLKFKGDRGEVCRGCRPANPPVRGPALM